MSCGVIEATAHVYRRIAELLTTYSSLRLQVVDACMVALAERLDLREVAALDRRGFLLVAPRHPPEGERLALLAARLKSTSPQPPAPSSPKRWLGTTTAKAQAAGP